MECVAEQEELGIGLDYDKAVRHRDELLLAQEEKVTQLKEVMPKVPKITKKEKPKVTHKKDGTLSVQGEKWFRLLKDNKLPMNFNGVIEVVSSYEEPNPGSPHQVKAWLDSLGWKPTTWKYVREADGSERKIPQVRKDGELCPSVLRLIKHEPRLEVLEGLTVIQHRLGVFQGFIDSAYQKNGPCGGCKDGVDWGGYECQFCSGTGKKSNWYVTAGIAGLTNTLRFKHKKPIANLPKVGVPWGEKIRGCLIAHDDETLCGSDLVGIESSTRDHYIMPLDPDLVEESNKSNYDPHLTIAKMAGMISEEDYTFFGDYKDGDIDVGRYKRLKDIRQKAKTVNYSAMYGVGAAKLARETDMPVKEAKLLLDTFWQINWAVKEVAKDTPKKTLPNGEIWLFNPVSNFWHSLRFERDAWSTLNQSTGVFVFDTWVAYSRKEGEKVVLNYHDEVVIRTKDEKKTEENLTRAIDFTNKKVKLNVLIGVDTQFGPNYAKIH